MDGAIFGAPSVHRLKHINMKQCMRQVLLDILCDLSMVCNGAAVIGDIDTSCTACCPDHIISCLHHTTKSGYKYFLSNLIHESMTVVIVRLPANNVIMNHNYRKN